MAQNSTVPSEFVFAMGSVDHGVDFLLLGEDSSCSKRVDPESFR
ncbi:hypothetical protein ACFRAE_13660 [Sphingobacterium sp. HJSM2_6]